MQPVLNSLSVTGLFHLELTMALAIAMTIAFPGAGGCTVDPMTAAYVDAQGDPACGEGVEREAGLAPLARLTLGGLPWHRGVCR
jgi:hypothetical protein